MREDRRKRWAKRGGEKREEVRTAESETRRQDKIEWEEEEKNGEPRGEPGREKYRNEKNEKKVRWEDGGNEKKKTWGKERKKKEQENSSRPVKI